MKTPSEWFILMTDEEKDEMFQWTIEGLKGSHRSFVESVWEQWTCGRTLSEKQINAVKGFHDSKGKGKFY